MTKCISSVSQNGGSYVLAVDAGRERILSVWQWQWGHLLGKVAVSCRSVHYMKHKCVGNVERTIRQTD